MTIFTVLDLIAIAGSVAATSLAIVRPASDQSSLPLDYLARQARPMGKSRMILSFVSAGCVVVAFVLFFFDDPKGANSILVVVTVAVLLLGQFATHHFQRVRALEEIIRRSHPGLYSEIEGGKG